MPNFKVFRADDGAVIIASEDDSVYVSPEDVVPLAEALMPNFKQEFDEFLRGKGVDESCLIKLDPVEEAVNLNSAAPNSRRRWTETELNKVAKQFLAGESYLKIAQDHGRTEKAIAVLLSTRLSHLERRDLERSASVARAHAARRAALTENGGG